MLQAVRSCNYFAIVKIHNTSLRCGGDFTSRISANSDNACTTSDTLDDIMYYPCTACDYGLEEPGILAVVRLLYMLHAVCRVFS